MDVDAIPHAVILINVAAPCTHTNLLAAGKSPGSQETSDFYSVSACQHLILFFYFLYYNLSISITFAFAHDTCGC